MLPIPALVGFVPRALLFDGDVYLEIKSRPRAGREGARFLLVLGTALGLAGALSAIVGWATTPDLADVRRVLAQELATLPLLQRPGPSAPQSAALVASPWLWVAARWLCPTPLLALARLPAVPAGLFLGWLAHSLLAHVAACLLGGRGRLSATLGCLALAEAPRALLLVPLLPPLGLAHLGIWAWVLAARFQAIRAAHAFEGWRAFWATLLPALAVGALSALAGGVALLAALAGLP